jgi:hypothetical protein
MRRFLIIVGGFVCPLLLPSIASAQEFNHTITVYATVPEQRAIYLDQYGAVIKIAGNTTRNVQPKVYDSSNREAPVSPDIQRQYDDFLRQHGGKLEASRIYNINPLKVDNSTQTQKISVNNRSLPINLSL